MKAIGFKNFRRFENFPEMNLGGVNFLVGANNSGKSTVTKATLLVRNFLLQQVYSTGRYSKINTSNDYEVIRPRFTFDVTEPYDVSICTVKNALCNHAKDNTMQFSCEYDEIKFIIDLLVNDELTNETDASVECLTLIDNKNHISYTIDYSKNLLTIELLKSESESDEPSIESLQEEIKKLENALQAETDFAKIAEINQEIQSLRNLISVKTTNKNQGKVIMPIPFDSTQWNGTSYLIAFFVNLLNISATDYHLPDDLPNKTYWNKELKNIKNFLHTENRTLFSSFELIGNIINMSIEDIPAHYVRQQIFYNTKDHNDEMAKNIHDYMSMDAETYYQASGEKLPGRLFIEKWMKPGMLEIGDDFRIVSHGEAYEIDILEDDKWMPLANKGMGSIQIMMVLIKLATFIQKYGSSKSKPTIFVEEPERNLHPKMQSLLTEVFYELNKEYSFQFIIETHSEYLIRKSQVIVAKQIKEAPDSPIAFTVYYFPRKGVPYSMRYLPTGRFENKFDSGFFDEASRFNIELTKLERGL